MPAPAGSILPDTYFDSLSTLWGGCAFVGGAIVAAGLVFQAVRSRPEPTVYLWLLAKVGMIAVATLFLREWLMRLNDVLMSFVSILGIDPRAVDQKFVTFISGKTAAEPDASVWDVIWDTKSIGTAICYALLWFFGWLAWGLQYIVKLVGGILLTAGWALSPIFLGFFMLRPMTAVALKFMLGLAALVCWPFGWALAAVVTNAMLDATATASLIPIVIPGAGTVAPALSVLLVGAWMMVSAVLAPYVTTRVLLMGANPAGAFAQGVGGVAEATVAGGVGAATAAVTGGAAAAGVITAAAAGALSSGAESAARGGGSARLTSTAAGGLSGLYGGSYARRRTEAYESAASAFSKMADSAESMAASQAEQAEVFREFKQRMNRQRRERSAQPHHPDPNQAALEIEAYARN